MKIYYKLSVDDATMLTRLLDRYRNEESTPVADMSCFHTEKGVVSCYRVQQFILDIERFLGAV